MEMTNCVGGILDEITKEPCNEMELTTCVGGLLTKSDKELADELMEMTTCIGGLVDRSLVNCVSNENNEQAVEDAAQTGKVASIYPSNDAMEMTECVGQLLVNAPNDETMEHAAQMDLTTCVGGILSAEHASNFAQDEMEMTVCVGNIRQGDNDNHQEAMQLSAAPVDSTINDSQLEHMETTQCVGGILDRMNQSNGLQLTAYKSSIDECIFNEMDSILSNIPIMEEEMQLLEELNGSNMKVVLFPDNSKDTQQNPASNGNTLTKGFGSELTTGELESAMQLVPENAMDFTQVVGSLIMETPLEIPSFMSPSEKSFVADVPCPLEVKPKEVIETTKVEPVDNVPSASTSEVDFFSFLPNTNLGVNISLNPSDFDSTPKASLKEFLDQVEIRFLDNLKSKARRETIVKQRDSEIVTVAQRFFFKYGLSLEVGCYESACASLGKIIEQKRTVINSMKHMFNYHPPDIAKEIAAGTSSAANPFLKSLKSNVRLWAKCDWRKFRLNFSKYLQSKLATSLTNLSMHNDQFKTLFDALQRELLSLEKNYNALNEKVGVAQQKEMNFQSLDLQSINTIVAEIATLEHTLQNKNDVLNTLKLQRSSVMEEITRENLKANNSQLEIARCKQCLEQHRFINQSEIDRQRGRLNVIAKLFGFKLTKVTPLVIEIQFSWKFSLVLQLRPADNQKTNTLDTVQLVNIICCNPNNDQDCLLLEQLLKKKIFKSTQQYGIETVHPQASDSVDLDEYMFAEPCSASPKPPVGSLLIEKFYKVALYTQRFIRLHQRFIQGWKSNNVVECDFKRGCYTVKKRSGETVVMFFDDQLLRIANQDKV